MSLQWGFLLIGDGFHPDGKGLIALVSRVDLCVTCFLILLLSAWGIGKPYEGWHWSFIAPGLGFEVLLPPWDFSPTVPLKSLPITFPGMGFYQCLEGMWHRAYIILLVP